MSARKHIFMVRNNDHSTYSELFIQGRHERQLKKYQESCEKSVKEINDLGFDNALSYVPSIVDPKKFVLIHATNHLPRHNMIRTSHTVALLGIPNLLNPTRETLHFTVNNVVSSHGNGNWDNCKYAIIFPYQTLAKRVHLSPLFDTTIVGNVKLPFGTFIIVRKERDLAILALPKTIHCWGKKIKVDKKVFELGKLARGLMLYDAHYASTFKRNRGEVNLRTVIKNPVTNYPNFLMIQSLLNISYKINDLIRYYNEQNHDRLTYETFIEFAECFHDTISFEHVCKYEDYNGKYKSIDKAYLSREHGIRAEIIETSKDISTAVQEELLQRNIPLITHYSSYHQFNSDKANIDRFKLALSHKPLHTNPYMEMVYTAAHDVLCKKLDSDKMNQIFQAYLNSFKSSHHGIMHYSSWYDNTNKNLLEESILQEVLKVGYIQRDDHTYWIKHPEEVKAIKRWLHHSRMQHRLKVMLYLIENRESDAALIDILLHCPNRKIAEKKIVSLGLSTDDVNSFLDLYDDVKKKISKIVLDYEKVHGQQVLEKLDKEEKWLAREYAEIHKNHKVYGRGVRKVWRLHNRVMKRFTEDMDPSIRNQYAIAHKKFLEDLETGDTNKIEKSINVQLSIIKLLEEWIKEHVLLSNEMKEHHN